jgi:dihydrofolate reductase/thymidylate synthase
MFNIILAHDNQFGIGKDNDIPWFFSSDMRHFKTLTTSENFLTPQNIVIMGRKTMETIPNHYLKDRVNIVISKSIINNTANNKNIIIVDSFTEALKKAYTYNGDVWVIGGSYVYNVAFKHQDLNKIYITNINGNFNCDVFVKIPEYKINKKYSIKEKDTNTNIIYNIDFIEATPLYSSEQQYLILLKDIIQYGNKRQTRNAIVYSDFSREITFNVSKYFPLLTTKKMFFKGIVEELLFFIRGDTNTLNLSEKGIKIWEGNTSQEFLNKMNLDYKVGDMGPMYGYQWRYFGKPYNENNGGVDQLINLINEIKTNPTSRRLLMTDFNPQQANEGVLYPCHSLILQFYVNNDYISVKMYQRSADLFLGLPFNIASTTLLLYIIGKLTNLKPEKVSITLGDCHIYECHLEAVKEQLSRNPLELPTLEIPDFKNLEDVEKSEYKDYVLKNYSSHPSIKAEMVA